MKTLKELLEASLSSNILDESSILDIEGTIDYGDKFADDIQNFNNMLKAKSLEEFNTCAKRFIKVLDQKTKPVKGDCVAKIVYTPICKGNSYENYRIHFGRRGTKKEFIIWFSPHVNKIFIDSKYIQTAKPFNLENTWYGVVPKIIGNCINL